MTYRDAIICHLSNFFAGHEVAEERFVQGPMGAVQEFSVLRVAPGSRTALWSYCSVCASTPATRAEEGVEFVLLSPRCDFRIVELVTMVAYYHRTEGLGVGHTFAIGEPWLDASRCDCILASLPYPFGPTLEHMRQEGHLAWFLWLLSITDSERQCARDHGLEGIEARFDSARLQYWDIDRAAVV
jgi:hypothetical protein